VHARLAIVDQGGLAHQPMTDPETGTTVAFNGEIYNYPELRSELAAYPYRTDSDTGSDPLCLQAMGHRRREALPGHVLDGHRRRTNRNAPPGARPGRQEAAVPRGVGWRHPLRFIRACACCGNRAGAVDRSGRR
jgi:hypothetical protein